MVRILRSIRSSRLALMVAVLLLPTLILAAERFGKASKAAVPAAQQETVDMFAAIDAGQIGVRLIPKDSTQSQVLIENKTQKPLTVKLPEAFAGVPVLAQAIGNDRNNNNNSGNMNQGMGGGMGGMGMGGMGMGGGMGMFNVAPKRSESSPWPPSASNTARTSPAPPSPMKSSPSKASPTSPRCENCAGCSAAANSTSGRLRRQRGT